MRPNPRWTREELEHSRTRMQAEKERLWKAILTFVSRDRTTETTSSGRKIVTVNQTDIDALVRATLQSGEDI